VFACSLGEESWPKLNQSLCACGAKQLIFEQP